MAQMGSFVPASSAVIGLVDRIFTASVPRMKSMLGQSTFMVEMIEARQHPASRNHTQLARPG